MSDEPIILPSDDALGRNSLAQIIAEDLENLEAKDGAVVAINGPWGSGKTSLIHLIVHHLRDKGRIVPVFFNPWMFSDSEELISRFFEEVSGQLSSSGLRVKAISSTLAKYGDALTPLGSVPIFGTYAKGASSVMKAPSQFRALRSGSLHEQREKLRSQLSSLDTPILVVIDDIDRLERREIREVLKLVRLTGNFPNVLYLLAFDRRRVEQAILEGTPDDPSSPTSSFLDKIVQFDYEVPEISPMFVARQLELGIERVLARAGPLTVDAEPRFPKVYWDLFAPIFLSLRDVKRFLGPLASTVRSVGDRVDFHDLLSLEAIRVLRPNVFAAIRRNRNGLAFTSDDHLLVGTDALKTRAERSIQSLRDVGDEDYVVGLVRHLFQYCSSLVDKKSSDSLDSLLSSRRVAHRDVLNFYLGRFEGRFLRSSLLSQEALSLSTSRDSLRTFLQGVDHSELADMLRALASETQNLGENLVEPLVTELLNLAPSIQGTKGLAFEISPIDAIERTVFNSISSVEKSKRSDLIRHCLANIHSLEGKRMLFDVIADESPVGGALVAPEISQEAISVILDAYTKRTPKELSSEPKLLWLTKWLIDYGGLSPEAAPDLLSYPQNALSLLRSAKYWILNARSADDSHSVDLEALVTVLGDRSEIQRLIDITLDIS